MHRIKRYGIMTKRFLSLLFALSLSLTSLMACGESAQDAPSAPAQTASADTIAETEAAEETEEIVYDDLADNDFGGASYIIAGLSNRTTTAVTSSELNGEVINDAQYNAARAVEERFNVKVSYEDIASDDGAMGTAIKNLVLSGEEKYSVTFGVDTNQITQALNGMYHNLKNIPQFNWDQPWWIDSTETISVGDKSYVASSYLSYFCLYYMRLFVINKSIASDLGLELPYQKVYDGIWYFDDLLNMAQAATADIDGDGSMTDKDRYGISYGALYTLQSSSGITIIPKDDDNMPYINLDAEQALKYLQKAEPLFLENGYYGDNSAYGANFFSSGQSLFCYCNLREVVNIIRNSEIDYGFLPAPKLDELQEDYMTVATDVYWGIPSSCVSQLDMIGTVTEALSCQHYNFVRPAFFETTMKTKLSYSEDDSNMLDLVASKLSIDFGFAYQSNISAMGSIDDMINDKVKSDKVASTLEKKRSSIEKSLDKILTAYDELP